MPKIGLEGKPNVYLMRVLPSEGQIKIFNVSGFEYSDKSKVGMEAKPSINEKEFAVLLKLLQATGSARESFGCVRR